MKRALDGSQTATRRKKNAGSSVRKLYNGLPVSEGYDAICVIEDKLSKKPIDAPTYKTADSKDNAK